MRWSFGLLKATPSSGATRGTGWGGWRPLLLPAMVRGRGWSGADSGDLRPARTCGPAAFKKKRSGQRAAHVLGEERGGGLGVRRVLTLPGRARHGGGSGDSGEKSSQPGGTIW